MTLCSHVNVTPPSPHHHPPSPPPGFLAATHSTCTAHACTLRLFCLHRRSLLPLRGRVVNLMCVTFKMIAEHLTALPITAVRGESLSPVSHTPLTLTRTLREYVWARCGDRAWDLPLENIANTHTHTHTHTNLPSTHIADINVAIRVQGRAIREPGRGKDGRHTVPHEEIPHRILAASEHQPLLEGCLAFRLPHQRTRTGTDRQTDRQTDRTHVQR